MRLQAVCPCMQALLNRLMPGEWGICLVASPARCGAHMPGITMDLLLCRYWIWVGIAFNFAAFVLLTSLTGLCLHSLNLPKKVAIMKSKESIQASLECAPRLPSLSPACSKGRRAPSLASAVHLCPSKFHAASRQFCPADQQRVQLMLATLRTSQTYTPDMQSSTLCTQRGAQSPPGRRPR
jgi:hypothetical protein